MFLTLLFMLEHYLVDIMIENMLVDMLVRSNFLRLVHNCL